MKWRETTLEDLKKSQPTHIEENRENIHSAGNTRSGTGPEITSVTHGSDKRCQQQPGIELGLHWQKHGQLKIQGTDTGQNEARLSDYVDSTGLDSRAKCLPARKGRMIPQLTRDWQSCHSYHEPISVWWSCLLLGFRMRSRLLSFSRTGATA